MRTPWRYVSAAYAQVHKFLTCVLDGSNGQHNSPDALPLRYKLVAHWIEGWVMIWRRENSLFPAGIWTPDSYVHSLVIISNTPSRVRRNKQQIKAGAIDRETKLQGRQLRIELFSRRRKFYLLQIIRTGAEGHPTRHEMSYGFFLEDFSERGLNLATYFIPALMLRKSGDIPPLLYVPSWRSLEQIYLIQAEPVIFYRKGWRNVVGYILKNKW